MRKKILSCLFTVVIIALPVLARAQDADADKHRGEHIQEVFNQLNLTDEQKKELDANKQEARASIKSLHQQMKQAHEAMQAELMKTQLDMGRIHVLHAQIKSFENQEEDLKLNSILAVRQILTTDQFTKFINMMHRHKSPEEHP